MSIENKPSRNEEEYFAKLEADRLKERREAAKAEAAQAERLSHYMKCPKCGGNLVTEEYHAIQIDRCQDCEGMWFDAGEAELLVAKESAGVGGLFKSIFRGVKGKTADEAS